jgi:multidrug resistance efflux pump
MRIRVILFVAFAVVLAGLLWWSQQRSEPVVVSGVIEADEIRIGSRVGGRVSQVLIEEGSVVAKGEKLLELEPFDLTELAAQNEQLYQQAKAEHDKRTRGFRSEEKAQAKARLAQAKARLEELTNGPRKQEIEAAQAEVAFAEAGRDLAKQNLDRIQSLAREDAATRQRLDQAESEARTAAAQVRARSEQLEQLQIGTRPEELAQAQAQVEEATGALSLLENGYRDEEIAEAYAAMQAADAARRSIQVQISELEVRAPLDGVVEAIELKPGDIVGANVPAIALIDMSHLWVRAYVPEDKVSLQIGQKVPLTVDSFPGETFTGRVTFIAREAEFTPNNVQTPEERSKQVFRIKVELETGLDKLRPGTAADVWIDKPPPP